MAIILSKKLVFTNIYVETKFYLCPKYSIIGLKPMQNIVNRYSVSENPLQRVNLVTTEYTD